jgi:hypothetical protein
VTLEDQAGHVETGLSTTTETVVVKLSWLVEVTVMMSLLVGGSMGWMPSSPSGAFQTSVMGYDTSRD